jgi:hypothetical protein
MEEEKNETAALINQTRPEAHTCAFLPRSSLPQRSTTTAAALLFLRYFDLGVHVSAQHMHRSHTPRFHTSQPGFDMQRSLHNLGCSPPPSRLYVRLSHPALGLPHMHHPSTQPAGLKLPDLVDEASFLWLAVRAPFAGPDPHPNPDLLRILHVRCRCVICRTRNQAQHISGKNLHFRPGITHHSLCGFVISPPHSCTFVPPFRHLGRSAICRCERSGCTLTVPWLEKTTAEIHSCCTHWDQKDIRT